MKTSVTLALQVDSFVSPFLAKDFDNGLDWAASIGVTGVELSVASPADIDVSVLKEKLNRRDLIVSTLATGVMVAQGLTFCDDNENVRQAAVRHIISHIELASQLPGHPNVTIGMARGKGGGTSQQINQQRHWIADCLQVCCRHSNNRGIWLNLEPFVRYESEHFHTSAQCAQLIDEIGGKGTVGILYDTYHSNVEDADMVETIKQYATYLSHVHFADSNRRLPGEGHIDFTAIMTALHRVKYDRYITLEVTNTPDAEHIQKNVGKFVKLANS